VLPPPPLLVFAQKADARVDIDAWNAHGERFFGVRLGLAEDVRPAPRGPASAPAQPPGSAALPAHASVRLVVAPRGLAPGIRRASARPRIDDDLARADAAERRGAAGAGGLALLAARCPTVWLVERESEGDAISWALAVVLSSVLLGPIHDAVADRLVGAKTARAILDSLR
jgi:hypothetical protein